MKNILRVISFIVWIVRGFLSIWIALGFRLLFGDQKFKLPPITEQILLQPAIVVAKRIRLRQVIYRPKIFGIDGFFSVSNRSLPMKLFKHMLTVFDRFNHC